MTLREQLEAEIKADIKRNKTLVLTDKNGTKYTLDEKRNIMVGEKDGKEWIKQIDSMVPAYWHYCDNPVGMSPEGRPLICNAPSVVFITDDGRQSTCIKCKHVSTILINPAPGTYGHQLLQQLKKEG